MDRYDHEDAVTYAGTGEPFLQTRKALGLPGFSGARTAFNSTGTGPGIANGWRTSDEACPDAQTLTGTKRPATDPPRTAGDGLPAQLDAVAGYGPSGTSNYSELPSPTYGNFSSRCYLKIENSTLPT